MTVGGKYQPLSQTLRDSGAERVRLSFSELDQLCGLPATAYRDRPFWANTWRSNHAHSWLEAGYVVESVSLGHYIEFLHDPIRAKEPGAGRKNTTNGALISRGKSQETLRSIPSPCPTEAEKYLSEWDSLDGYPEQEDALDKLFLTLCPENKTLSDILLKTAALNAFYSTHIFSFQPVARHILSLQIDDRLAAGDLSLVEDIQQVKIKDKEKNFYSFASKYCSHHRPLEFPIYDSYVDKVLRYFRDRDGFSSFRNDQLKDYPMFKAILTKFQAAYGLEQYTIKEVDKYLWQLGKAHFPNQYGKRKSPNNQ